MWHTASWHEGRLRGLYDTAAHEYGPPHPTDPLAAIIAAADLTTGPTGQPTTIHRRLVGVRNRYPTDSLVVQALELAEADMRRLHTRGTHPRKPPPHAIGHRLASRGRAHRTADPTSRDVESAQVVADLIASRAPPRPPVPNELT